MGHFGDQAPGPLLQSHQGGCKAFEAGHRRISAGQRGNSRNSSNRMKLFRQVRYLLNRGAAERDLQDEMSAHREMLAEDRRTSFGSDLRLREQSREAWGFIWLDQLRQDLAYGARQLRRSPGFTLTA